jgi:hypothetical protein
LNQSLVLKDGWQQPLLDVHDHQARFRSLDAKRSFLHDKPLFELGKDSKRRQLIAERMESRL